jgi:hypothetical protein
LHLEGTLEPELLFRLSNENGITLPAQEDEAFASIENLLARYRRFTSLDGKHVYMLIMRHRLTRVRLFALLFHWDGKVVNSQNVLLC